MSSSPSSVSNGVRHAGPPLGIVATVFVVLFLAGLYPAIADPVLGLGMVSSGYTNGYTFSLDAGCHTKPIKDKSTENARKMTRFELSTNRRKR